MLSEVATAVTQSTRQVVLMHPNTMDCTVLKKVVTRLEIDPDTGEPREMGGAPTIGGMGMLSDEDEADYLFVELGPGKMLFCGVHQPIDTVDRDDAQLQELQQEAQVVSVAEEGEEEHYIADDGDVVICLPGLGTALVYEVVKVIGNLAIPPYTRKLVLNPLDELHQLEPFLPEADPDAEDE